MSDETSPDGGGAGAATAVEPGDRLPQRARRAVRRALPVAWVVLVALAAAALTCGVVAVGPTWLPQAGAVVVSAAYSWALAARTGGRPIVFGTLALAVAVAAVLVDVPTLRTGTAVGTSVVAAVLAVMATRPAPHVLLVVRESVVALVLACVGALATVAYGPTVELTRFEYVSLGLALAGALGLVYRLGAGLHGLGTRGAVAVVVGGAVLVVTLLYAELLRRYGSPEIVDTTLGWVTWSREHLGAFPRPVETVVGIPALAWGCHMRARRRQGWWLCAFGTAATASTAAALVNPAVSLGEAGLSVLYGLVVGLLIGLLLIRLDLASTGDRGRGRRAAGGAPGDVRPEPSRTAALQ